MKTLTSKLFGLAVLTALVLSSCNTTIEVAKRQYRKGYHISLIKKETNKVAEVAAAKTVAPKTEEAISKGTTEVTEMTTEEQILALTPKVEKTAAPKTTAEEKVAETKVEAKKPTLAQTFKAVRKVKKELKKAANNNNGFQPAEDLDDTTILYLILAILLPPLAVFLVKGLGNEFWISLILTLLFILPGVIYAILIVLGKI